MRIIEATELKFYKEFDNHALVVEINEPESGLHGYIAIHRKHKGVPSLGATRVWRYASSRAALQDVLRLSKLMSYKSALAGLPYGGAKAVLMLPKGGIRKHKNFFAAYGREVDALLGKFVTGTDVGMTNKDLESMQKTTDHVIGSGVNSGHYTSFAVFECIQIAAKHLFPDKYFKDITFAVQGLGKTGSELVDFLTSAGVRTIYASEVNKSTLKKAIKKYPHITPVKSKEIIRQKVDIFCPCALGGLINVTTVKQLSCKAVIGPANNQLISPQIGEQLSKRGIFYAPDYLVNAGGLISVVDQYLNKIASEKRIKKDLAKIPKNLEKILKESLKTKKPTNFIADHLAEKILYSAS